MLGLAGCAATKSASSASAPVASGTAGTMPVAVSEPRLQKLSAEDRATIEKLLEKIKSQKDLKFVRLDKVYSAKTAAWYMRLKWDQNSAKVKSVEDFIALQAVGGEHGEVTYYVEFPDGTRKTAREVMEGAVREIKQGQD